MSHPKFGQRVRAIYASESNPHRIGLFVEVIRRTGKMNRGTFYRMTDGKGDFWEMPVESCEILHEF